ncbi:MAG: ADP-ribosylglycohydrolase family protein [Desulfotignum sp.]|nr:ADP-ribosylglycohydrolase family protein [Desulfotignum sp.]MCF8090614.1 ADP-ribosylglycohydrolase family protein [Desulfotignum sp.]
MTEKHSTRLIPDHFTGCLIAGAIGDALGASIEFMTLDQIRRTHGESGLTGYAPVYGRTGAITDDTQMMLFTAEGLVLSRVRPEYSGDDGMIRCIYHALLRWLTTQQPDRQTGLIQSHGTCAIVEGVLTGHAALFSRRAPGNTCLSALASGIMGTLEHPVNDSKGCGGVMRIAPVGLAFTDPEKAFDIGCRSAAITHGHPTGTLASGTLAALISLIITGHSLTDAINAVIRILKQQQHAKETLDAVTAAIETAHSTAPSPETVETLGEGWIAEEALGIGLYCALAHENDMKKALLLSVNHSGDSDSTGTITGNILGALHGRSAIPQHWIDDLEFNDLVEETAMDLYKLDN